MTARCLHGSGADGTIVGLHPTRKIMPKYFYLLAAGLLLGGCAASPLLAPPAAERSDPHSFANTDAWQVEHLSLDLSLIHI